MVAQSEQAFLAIAQGNARQEGGEDLGVQGDGAPLRQRRQRRVLSSSKLLVLDCSAVVFGLFG